MCCSWILKFFMVVVNGGIFLVGAGLLGMGAWVTLDSGSLLLTLHKLIEDAPELKQLASVGYLLIGVGTALALIGFLGCCGAMKENRCMLLTFFIIVLILFIAQVAGAGVLLVFGPKAHEHFKDIAVDVVVSIEQEYGMSENVTTFWNTTMEMLKCCGYNNYTDFTESPFVNNTKLYPTECCYDNHGKCTASNAQKDNIQGCLEPLVELVEDTAYIVGVVALGICAVEVFAMIFSMYLYKQAGEKNYIG